MCLDSRENTQHEMKICRDTKRPLPSNFVTELVRFEPPSRVQFSRLFFVLDSMAAVYFMVHHDSCSLVLFNAY